MKQLTMTAFPGWGPPVFACSEVLKWNRPTTTNHSHRTLSVTQKALEASDCDRTINTTASKRRPFDDLVTRGGGVRPVEQQNENLHVPRHVLATMVRLLHNASWRYYGAAPIINHVLDETPVDPCLWACAWVQLREDSVIVPTDHDLFSARLCQSAG